MFARGSSAPRPPVSAGSSVILVNSAGRLGRLIVLATLLPFIGAFVSAGMALRRATDRVDDALTQADEAFEEVRNIEVKVPQLPSQPASRPVPKKAISGLEYLDDPGSVYKVLDDNVDGAFQIIGVIFSESTVFALVEDSDGSIARYHLTGSEVTRSPVADPQFPPARLSRAHVEQTARVFVDAQSQVERSRVLSAVLGPQDPGGDPHYSVVLARGPERWRAVYGLDAKQRGVLEKMPSFVDNGPADADHE